MPVTLSRARHSEKVWEQIVIERPGDPGAWHGLALALADADRAEEALSAVSEALRLDPDHASAHQVRGLLLVRLGRTKEALLDLERAAFISPTPDALFELGEAYLSERLYTCARDTFYLVTGSRPADPDAWGRLGLCHARCGEYEEALDAFARAARLDSEFMAVHPDAAAAERKARRLLALEATAPVVFH